jgi:hypothetical protein
MGYTIRIDSPNNKADAPTRSIGNVDPLHSRFIPAVLKGAGVLPALES